MSIFPPPKHDVIDARKTQKQDKEEPQMGCTFLVLLACDDGSLWTRVERRIGRGHTHTDAQTRQYSVTGSRIPGAAAPATPSSGSLEQAPSDERCTW